MLLSFLDFFVLSTSLANEMVPAHIEGRELSLGRDSWIVSKLPHRHPQVEDYGPSQQVS